MDAGTRVKPMDNSNGPEDALPKPQADRAPSAPANVNGAATHAAPNTRGRTQTTEVPPLAQAPYANPAEDAADAGPADAATAAFERHVEAEYQRLRAEQQRRYPYRVDGHYRHRVRLAAQTRLARENRELYAIDPDGYFGPGFMDIARDGVDVAIDGAVNDMGCGPGCPYCYGGRWRGRNGGFRYGCRFMGARAPAAPNGRNNGHRRNGGAQDNLGENHTARNDGAGDAGAQDGAAPQAPRAARNIGHEYGAGYRAGHGVRVALRGRPAYGGFWYW